MEGHEGAPDAVVLSSVPALLSGAALGVVCPCVFGASGSTCWYWSVAVAARMEGPSTHTVSLHSLWTTESHTPMCRVR